MEERQRSPLRLLAPIALVAFVLAFLAVAMSADVGSENGTTSARQAEERDLGERQQTTETASEEGERRLPDEVYVVKTGDTLAAIATKVGLGVEQLMELNPEIDPQALVSGQKIKLKE